MEDCVEEIRNWMTAHRLFIQTSKTEFRLSSATISKVLVDKLRLGEVMISSVSAVCDLGSWLDTHMSLLIFILAKFAVRHFEAFTILKKSGNT